MIPNVQSKRHGDAFIPRFDRIHKIEVSAMAGIKVKRIVAESFRESFFPMRYGTIGPKLGTLNVLSQKIRLYAVRTKGPSYRIRCAKKVT